MGYETTVRMFEDAHNEAYALAERQEQNARDSRDVASRLGTAAHIIGVYEEAQRVALANLRRGNTAAALQALETAEAHLAAERRAA